MTLIEQHIETSRTACLDFVNSTFGVLLEKVRANAEFLNEINEKEYDVSFIVTPETPSEIPTDAELAAAIAPTPTEEKAGVQELVERLDLEKESETTLIPADKWESLCNLVIRGWQGKEVTTQAVSASLIKQGFAITSDHEKHLETLRGIRREMMAKKMDLSQAQGQNGLSKPEKAALGELAKNNDLK